VSSSRLQATISAWNSTDLVSAMSTSDGCCPRSQSFTLPSWWWRPPRTALCSSSRASRLSRLTTGFVSTVVRPPLSRTKLLLVHLDAAEEAVSTANSRPIVCAFVKDVFRVSVRSQLRIATEMLCSFTMFTVSKKATKMPLRPNGGQHHGALGRAYTLRSRPAEAAVANIFEAKS